MNKFTSYPFFIQVALVVIFLLLIALVVTYIYIVSVRLKNNIVTRLSSKYQSKFREILITDIITKENPTVEEFEATLHKFKALHGDRKRIKNILIEDIKHFRAQFAGVTNELLRKLYIGLNLHAAAKDGIHSMEVDKVIFSIKELMIMNIEEPHLNTEVFLKHENQYIREITRRYIIAMEDNGIEIVLDDLTQPISGIEQLELFQAITGLGMREMPEFSKWIHIDKPYTLVSLCLKLVVHFQQFNSISVIEQLLVTDNQQLKKEAINALGKLLQKESELTLVNLYDEEDEETKIEIVKALGRIASGERLNFLKYIFDNESAIALKKHAAKSIVSHDIKSALFLTNMYKKASQENQVILNHALNTNIKY